MDVIRELETRRDLAPGSGALSKPKVRQGRVLKMDVSAFEAYENRSYQLDCLKVPQDLYLDDWILLK